MARQRPTQHFFTPVFYPQEYLAKLPQPFATLTQYNPMYLYLAQFRQIILSGQAPTLDLLLPGAAAAVLMLVLGWVLFTRVEDQFAYHF